MTYMLYEIARRKLLEAEDTLDEVLTEKQTAIREKRDTGQYDERLKEARSLIEDRETLLELRTRELRNSEDIHDRVFCLRFLDKVKVHKIAAACNYSEAQIYRIIGEINRFLAKDDR